MACPQLRLLERGPNRVVTNAATFLPHGTLLRLKNC